MFGLFRCSGDSVCETMCGVCVCVVRVRERGCAVCVYYVGVYRRVLVWCECVYYMGVYLRVLVWCVCVGTCLRMCKHSVCLCVFVYVCACGCV